MLDTSTARRAARVLFAASLLLQTYLLYKPAADEGVAGWNLDKLVHMSMFGGPALLALIGGWRWVPLALAAYAPLSEVIQGTDVVGRDCDWHDAVADVSGIIVAALLVRFVVRR